MGKPATSKVTDTRCVSVFDGHRCERQQGHRDGHKVERYHKTMTVEWADKGKRLSRRPAAAGNER